MLVAFFSGGKDSAVASHIAYIYAKKHSMDFKLVHVNTGINIPETEAYVEKYAKWLGAELTVLKPKIDYWEGVKKWGYPTYFEKRWCFHHLKQDPIVDFMLSEMRRGVLHPTYVLGVRRNESRFRMETYGRKWYVRHDRVTYKVWLPILHWDEKLIYNYIKHYNIPENPVWKKLGWSGECLCLAGTSLRNLDRLIDNYPDVAKMMAEKDKEIQKLRRSNKHPEGYPTPLLNLKIPLWKYVEERKKQKKLFEFDEGNKCMDCFISTLLSEFS
jgi:3'-phosphoadenosine 5'-phosphosulfate sulfotransferase (PAPS reductase)/FAD synthetase